MSTRPELVQLLEQGIVKLELADSDGGSLNNRSEPGGVTYNGRATSVKIFGPAGSGATFYDDQKFRTGQNAVYIEKLVDHPIEVFIARNFVDTNNGSAILSGQSDEFKWILFKTPIKDWWDRWIENLDFIDWEAIRNAAMSSGLPFVSLAGSVAATILDTSNASNNYRVDNCSSVQFGSV